MTIKRMANQPINIRIVSEQREQVRQTESGTILAIPQFMTEKEIRDRYKERGGIFPAQVCADCYGDVFSNGVCVNCVNE